MARYVEAANSLPGPWEPARADGRAVPVLIRPREATRPVATSSGAAPSVDDAAAPIPEVACGDPMRVVVRATVVLCKALGVAIVQAGGHAELDDQQHMAGSTAYVVDERGGVGLGHRNRDAGNDGALAAVVMAASVMAVGRLGRRCDRARPYSDTNASTTGRASPIAEPITIVKFARSSENGLPGVCAPSAHLTADDPFDHRQDRATQLSPPDRPSLP